MTRCIACGSERLLELISIEQIPVLCNELHASAESARRTPTGRMDLVFCRACGHYYNASFQSELLYYSPNYDTSLYASDVFQRYAEGLVQRLISRYDIRRKRVLEIGCGRGEFLKRLCRAGGNRGLGFDTSTTCVGTDPDMANVSYVRDYFSAKYDTVRADLIVCQQVLEHVASPEAFLRKLAATQTFRHGRPVVYFEVPNGLYTVRDLGVWDLIYEHVSYFTPSSLRRVFEASGFQVLDIGTAFGGQYLYVEAQLAPRACESGRMRVDAEDIAAAQAFALRFGEKIERFREWSLQAGDALSRTYVWGAGSKGITFCNLIDPAGRIAGVIDRNHAKHGKFIAGTGRLICGLDAVRRDHISQVVVMNPQYRKEVGDDLAAAGLSPELVAA